jgi:Cu(I)/Ag(I) efflux system membrane fusion protein/cobalt-zinc-cadmium efflux system membrane fusion protein
MKRTFKTILIFTAGGIVGVLGYLLATSTGTGRTIPAAASILPEEAAAQEGLKAGLIDPKTGKKIKYWVAPMDPTYIRNEPGKSPMGMDLVPVYEDEAGEKEPSSTIRIDPVTLQNMGVRTVRVEKKPIAKEIRAYGNLTYDETRVYTVNTKFNGWIEKIFVDFEGELVKRGQPLFAIYSPELVTAQEEYLLAQRQYQQVRNSDYDDVRQSARRLLEASRKRLEYWDMTGRQIGQLEENGRPRKTVTVFSPASGVVFRKNAFEGHYVKAGEHQYEIADLSTVWVDVDVYESDLPWVRKGMPAIMDLSYIPGRRFTGKVLYVYPYLETKTRTAKLRLAFSNPKLELKPGMYANVHLNPQVSEAALVIPQEAVIDSGTRKVVFVALGKGRFQPREVTLGVEGDGDRFQVLEGLSEGEEIVVSAQFMLDSESRLREAIQKMLEVRRAGDTEAVEDLDMSGLTMDSPGDDLSMEGLTMEDKPPRGRPQ